MKVVVFGASGKVGKLVVNELLQRNYEVTAFVHSHNPLPKNPNLKIVRGSVYDSRAVLNTIKNQDVVISTLGSWGTKQQDVVSSGIENIIKSMEQMQIKRVVSLTGIAHWQGDKPSIFDRLNRALLLIVAPKILKDGEKHIQLLAKSDLDWTVIRSPVMTSGDNFRYELNTKLAGLFASIPRRAVASAIIEQIKNNRFIANAPVIHKN
jgi:putative NADH-flavin reductase